ncbi:NUDIX domain-containing protein [Jeotgalibacillus haloalkalitolerans]|uniref:NUDIX domain-containing protein n=1 Tax=Jeotgalibacillus haloalkalitolerans TaxID=3104292 RepID=A0ABU5KN05_9BACL|nr:NUDIX domain-containing protein [Jeotgalibacillus sp. HH7-29]MDZ5712632.1 NUDIX domain-containing protein [Jeotgalibacillus sp. HH7-29]
MFIVNVEAAIYRDDRWLMIRRSEKEEHAGGGLAFVGGQVDQEGFSYDILERSLEREVFEEVGIKVEVEQYVNSSSFITDTGKHVVDIVFLCRHISGEAFAKSGEEVDNVYWFTKEELLRQDELPDFLKRNLEMAFRKAVLSER